MKRISIWIPGQPSRTTHQSGTRIGRHGTYKSPALVGWEKTLERALREYVPDQPIEGPILLKAVWGYKAKTKKEIGTYKITKPDTDNMQKTLKDVMTKMGFWHDDAQVVSEACTKMWVSDPGIAATIEPLGGEVNDWLTSTEL